uniref:NAC transcription factors 7 n=1 Tax=Rhizophora mucronata TaxID=61149 RepID=A0A2P2NJS0_RHIMU
MSFYLTLRTSMMLINQRQKLRLINQIQKIRQMMVMIVRMRKKTSGGKVSHSIFWIHNNL